VPAAPAPAEPVDLAAPVPPPIPSGPQVGARTLFLLRDDGAEVAVRKERFVIGRGRHCDLVVDSSKVSREHAVVVRDDAGWLVEDLQSANGTWHRGARLEKLRLQDGDEFFVCAERIRCQLR
jgi:pSer/pThr/pTyr-binding forkhead associated (FHA) protein